MALLPCKHTNMCRACIQDWMDQCSRTNRPQTCPVGREVINSVQDVAAPHLLLSDSPVLFDDGAGIA